MSTCLCFGTFHCLVCQRASGGLRGHYEIQTEGNGHLCVKISLWFSVDKQVTPSLPQSFPHYISHMNPSTTHVTKKHLILDQYVVSQKKGPVIHDVSKMLENCCQDLQVTANQGDLSKYSGLYHPSNVETTNKGKNIGGSVVHLMCQNTTSLL